MTYICKNCGINEVDNQGDICELCTIGQDPYANIKTPFHTEQTILKSNEINEQSDSTRSFKKVTKRKILLNGGASSANQDLCENGKTVYDLQPTIQTRSTGKTPHNSQQVTTVTNATPKVKISNGQPIAMGIVKNISVDNQKKSIFQKWFRVLFNGIPFAVDDNVTMFQVFPDFSGSSFNALGNACDQVIVYGKINNGVVSENNDIEVYGRRDSSNNIIAKTIKNKASGTTITPTGAIGQGLAWIITILILPLLMTIGVWVVIIGVLFLIIKKLFGKERSKW